MNKSTKINVQTPVGTTDECECGRCTLEGAIVRAVNLDSDSEYEVQYGDVALQPLGAC